MYYPKQIPYLLDEDFNQSILYKEFQILELEDFCMCMWYMKSKTILNKVIDNNILPDACIDLVIDFENEKICFSGFSKNTESFSLCKNIEYLGVRLKPGSFFSIFDISSEKIMDNMISIKQIDKTNNLDTIFLLNEISSRIEFLKNYLLSKIGNKQNNYMEIINELYESPSNQKVILISKRYGYDKRQLQRIFKKFYGVSPKVLLNILRLHLCLTLLLDENETLLDISVKSGFYDQSHFIKEIKRYTGISPLKLLKQYKK